MADPRPIRYIINTQQVGMYLLENGDESVVLHSEHEAPLVSSRLPQTRPNESEKYWMDTS